MKKLLTMALALVMILSLFAVPTMAAAGNLITNGDFQAFDPGTTSSASTFGADSNTSSSPYTKVVDLNGNRVLQLGSSSGSAQYRANTIDFVAGKTYTVSADVYVMVAGAAKGEVKFLNLGTKINPDAEKTTEGLTFAAGGSSTAFYIPVFNDWVHLEATITPATSATKYLQVTFVGGSGATDCAIGYLDNVVITEYVAPTTAAVTISGANAVTSVAADTVTVGEGTTYTVKPQLGYYITGITVGGNAFNGFDAYKGGTYTTGAINSDTAIVVTTAPLSEDTSGTYSTEVATLPAVFAPAADSAVTFGKVLDTTDATSWGIELTKGGVGVTPANGGSYLYKANATNANGQYAIEFIGLEAGTYQIRSYAYVNGVAEFGAPSTFTVD